MNIEVERGQIWVDESVGLKVAIGHTRKVDGNREYQLLPLNSKQRPQWKSEAFINQELTFVRHALTITGT